MGKVGEEISALFGTAVFVHEGTEKKRERGDRRRGKRE